MTGAMLVACTALAGCGQAAGRPASADQPAPSAATVAPTVTQSAAMVDPAVQQRVKNGCIAALEAQASLATPPPGLLHPQKARLVRVAFLGDIRQVELTGDVFGYELGLEFVYALGHNDPRTGRKLCRINLADSHVDWRPFT